MARDPLQTKICEMLGIEFPIFAFTHCKDVAAAVSNAGGLGVLGMGGSSPEEIRAEMRWLRDRCGDRPFGLDLIFPASVPETAMNREQISVAITDEHRDFARRYMEKHNLKEVPPRAGEDREMGPGGGFASHENARQQVEVAIEEAPAVIVAGLGSPAFFLDAAHEKGIKVGGLIGRVRQAQREIDAGVDFVIAQGYDGGGHTGDVGTFTLVPRVVSIAGDTPVLCAGGVGTGRHLAAALCMGAAGTWSGTLFLATRESDTDIMVKEKIIASTEEDTIRSRSWSGKPMRQLRNEWNLAWEDPSAPIVHARGTPTMGHPSAWIRRASGQRTRGEHQGSTSHSQQSGRDRMTHMPWCRQHGPSRPPPS